MFYIKNTLLIILLFIGFYSTAQITLEVKDITCEGKEDGEIKVIVGISGPFEYSLSIENSDPFGDPVLVATQTSNTFSSLAEGYYYVSVTDTETGCQIADETFISSGEDIRLSIGGGGENTFCIQDGPPEFTLTASASGGHPPYTYNWPGGVKKVSYGGTFKATVEDSEGCTEKAFVDLFTIPIICSRDPNDIIGPAGYDEPQWVSVNDNLAYTIRFENDPEFASAPAQLVRIEQEIDVDLNQFSLHLGDYGFANMLFEVPTNSTYYSKRLDLTDSLNVLVDVTAGIDVTENKAFWIFEAIDPLTGLEPTDPLDGLLPVNDTLLHNGEGYVTYTVLPKSTAVTGDTISAEATIVFDDNDAINTNRWTNVIDAVSPNSSMNSLPSIIAGNEVELNWVGTDDPNGVGVAFYDLYVSEDGGPFTLLAGQLDTTAYVFNGLTSVSYAFYTIATDHVGNREGQKIFADEQITFGNECEETLIINMMNLLSGVYRSKGILYSFITSVREGSSVSFRSDTGVQIYADFTVELGAEFEVVIEPCN